MLFLLLFLLLAFFLNDLILDNKFTRAVDFKTLSGTVSLEILVLFALRLGVGICPTPYETRRTLKTRGEDSIFKVLVRVPFFELASSLLSSFSLSSSSSEED